MDDRPRATLSDPNAFHVSAENGERPGFDPRMNDFAFEFTFLEDPLTQTSLDVDFVAADILTLARAEAFGVSLRVNPLGAGSPVAPVGRATLIATPQQSFDEIGTSGIFGLDADAAGILWREAILAFSGSATAGEVWILTLNGVEYRHFVPEGEQVLSRIASSLAEQIAPDGYDVELRISLLGTARLFISRADGAPFTLDLEIDADPDVEIEITDADGVAENDVFTVRAELDADGSFVDFVYTADADDELQDVVAGLVALVNRDSEQDTEFNELFVAEAVIDIDEDVPANSFFAVQIARVDAQPITVTLREGIVSEPNDGVPRTTHTHGQPSPA